MIGPIRWGPLKAGHVDVHDVEIGGPHLPAGLDGLRVALLSDLHYGFHCTDDYVRGVFELTAAQRPDIVMLCGDMIHGTRYADRFAPLLAEAAEGLPLWAVAGNHDRDIRFDRYRRALARAGVDLIVNGARRLHPRGPDAPAVTIVGIDDHTRGRADWAAAFQGVDPEDFTLAAVHDPDTADRAPSSARIDTLLAGHTHGGQVRLFGRPPIRRIRNRNYTCGLIEGPGFPMYVSRGLGYAGIPVRIGADPELPILVLRGASPDQLPVER